MLLVHNCAQTVDEPPSAQPYDLPDPVRHMALFDDFEGWVGFRPPEAATIAASRFPPLGPDEDPLGDGTGRRLDTETGELVPAPVTRKVIISGGLLRIVVGHGRTRNDPLDQDPSTDEPPPNRKQATPADPNIKEVVTDFSRRSRNYLRMVAASIDWYAGHQPGWALLLVTLTYPGDWRAAAPTPDHVNRHRRAFGLRFKRATGYDMGVLWKREFQERGAPHLHLVGWWPWSLKGGSLRQWVSKNWYEVVGTGLPEHLNAGTRIDVLQSLEMSDPLRLGLYFAGYTSAKGSKEYQNEAPEGWRKENGSVGRYWGVTGLERYGAEVLVTERDMIAIQRMLRGVLRANLRDPKDRRRPRTRRTRYSRRGHGPNGMRKRAIHRRQGLSSLTGTDSGFGYLTTDGPRLGLYAAQLLHLDQTPPWPRGQRRPLP